MKINLVLAVILGSAVFGAAALAKGPKGDLSRFDQDGDGKVAVSELDAHHKEMMARADKDGDGVISKDEMKAMHEDRWAEHKARMFPDADNDGAVSLREFEDAARARFKDLDKNGDGEITKEEMADGRHGRRHGH